MRSHAQQKAALTRATKSRDPERVIAEVRKVKAEWNASYWPDDWSRWQRALDDVLTWPNQVHLDDL